MVTADGDDDDKVKDDRDVKVKKLAHRSDATSPTEALKNNPLLAQVRLISLSLL